MPFTTRLPRLIAPWTILLLLSMPAPAGEPDPRRRMWPEVYKSTRKEWVDYGEAGDTLSRVDFEKGRFEIQVLVPIPDSLAGTAVVTRLSDLDEAQWAELRAAAQKKVALQVDRMLSRAEPGMPPVLKDQVLDPDDRFMVEAKHATRYTRDHLIPQMVVDERPVAGTDLVRRFRIKVQFELVPDHMLVRARRYKQLVLMNAKAFDLDPALIYAVIHSESYFDPLSVSGTGAKGLMQLMPGAASEADRFLRKAKKERRLSAEYLYDPANNIRLGSAYLHLLQVTYFSNIKNRDHRAALCAAAYNCGPFYVKKHIVARNNIDALSGEQLLKLLKKRLPRETRYYVPRVLERMSLYKDI